MAWVCVLTKHKKANRMVSFPMRQRRDTLRIGPKEDKLMPRLVYRCGSQSEGIAEFLAFKRLVNGFRK